MTLSGSYEIGVYFTKSVGPHMHTPTHTHTHSFYRWGHGGYKEQNPEDFVSNDEETNEKDNQKTSRKRKRSKKHMSPMIPSKKRKHKQKHEAENSDSDNLEKLILTPKKHKKCHKRDHKSGKYLRDRTKHTHKPKTKDRSSSESDDRTCSTEHC